MPFLGIGTSPMLRRGGGIILSASLKSKFLFLWTGKRSGDNLLSDLDSSVITVTGSDFTGNYIPATSSATFSAPDTTAFKNADSDYIWFYTNASRRSVVVAELIGYDFGRTLVKYDDSSPHNIRAICILKAGETLTEEETDIVFRYFWLSIFWNNSLNLYGHLKGNRITQSVWTAEIVAPACVSDGNTVAWYDSSALSTITKDANNYITRWNNKAGNSASDLVNVGGAPVWSASGVTFDGVDDMLKTNAFTYVQPEFVYIVVKQLSWTTFEKIIDGSSANKMVLGQYTGTPQLGAYAGSFSSNISPALNTWAIIRVLFNGASSKLILNNDTPVTGSFGTSAAGGITIGAEGGGTARFGNCQIKEAIFRKVADNSTDETAIYNYLKTKYGL